MQISRNKLEISRVFLGIVRIPSILFFPLEAQVHRTVKDSVTMAQHVTMAQQGQPELTLPRRRPQCLPGPESPE